MRSQLNGQGACAARSVLALGWLAVGSASAAQGPAFDCAKVQPDSIEKMICDDSGLGELDRKLAEVYAGRQEEGEE